MRNKDIKQPTGNMLMIGFGIIFLLCTILYIGISNSNIILAGLAAFAYTVIAFPLLNIIVGLIFKFTGYYEAARVHLIVGVSITALLLVWWIYSLVAVS
ncbi:MAG: hypothetical protein BM555_04130 [Crocinitomix sp. MedPE-SWsnd]|jgi:hypothetical protein|nr:MAG: hypothetical protein BM555_04130 [Crocinitomix sp. MedPE-SWsnd]